MVIILSLTTLSGIFETTYLAASIPATVPLPTLNSAILAEAIPRAIISAWSLDKSPKSLYNLSATSLEAISASPKAVLVPATTPLTPLPPSLAPLPATNKSAKAPPASSIPCLNPGATLSTRDTPFPKPLPATPKILANTFPGIYVDGSNKISPARPIPNLAIALSIPSRSTMSA